MEKAFQDLVWLSNRLSGITALKDELKDYADLKNQAEELKKVSEQKRNEITQLEDNKTKLKADQDAGLEKLNKSIVDADELSKQKLAKANETANAVLQKADEEARKSIEKAEGKASDIYLDIDNKSKQLKELIKQVEEAEQRLAKARKDLENLRNKL